MDLKDIKQYFFAYRNGNTADILKRGGSRFRIIFGCDVPSLSSLARTIGRDGELARRLWADRDVRESRLLAPWLMDPESLCTADCMDLARDAVDPEEAMMLAFRVLKRRTDAQQLLEMLEADPTAAEAAKALRRHLA